MSRPLTVGILGAGIGAEHLAAYRRLVPDFQVRWMCDLDVARARSVVGDDSTVGLTSDVAQLLDDQTLDIIDICLPPHLHVPFTLRALEAGKHVICEKPLACSLADIDRLEQAVARSGRRIFPVFQYRFGTGMAQLRHLIDAGLAGSAFAASLETHWNRGGDYYAAPWRGSWAGEQGGAILGHAIHAHDLITHVLGPVAQVSATLATRVNPIETEDCAAIALTLKSGALVTSSVTLGAADDRSRIRIMFQGLTAESGRAPYAPMAGDWHFTARAPRTQDQIDAALSLVATVAPGFDGFLGAVRSAINSQSDGAVTLADARHSIELVTAIYQAAATGQTQSLPLSPQSRFYRGWAPDGETRT